MPAAAGSANTAIKRRDKKPVDVQLVIFYHQLAGHAPFLGRANQAELMQGGVKRKTTPYIAGGTTAGTGADHHGIVFARSCQSFMLIFICKTDQHSGTAKSSAFSATSTVK